MLKIKNINKILILTILISSFFSTSNALKIIIWDKVQENVIIKKTSSAEVSTEKVFETYAKVFASNLPESYRYINLNFKNINKNDKIYSSLQKLIYTDLLPNSTITINSKAKFSKKLFYWFANNFAWKQIFKLNPESANLYVTESDLEKLIKKIEKRKRIAKKNEEIKTKKKEKIFEEKVERMYDVFETITKKHYSSSEIDKNKMIDTAIEGMAIGSMDKFTTYFPPQKNKNFQTSLMWKYEWIWAYVHMPKPWILEVIAPLSGTPAHKAWIRAKDIFLEVDGKKVTKENSLLEIVSWIKWPAWTKVKIKVKRWKKTLLVEVERKKITIENIIAEKVSRDTFYIKILFFWNDVVKDFKKALEELKKEKNIKKVIIDLRNNPGWYLWKVADILSYFVEKWEKTVVVKEKNSSYSYKSAWYDLINFGKYRIIILQNKGSASASEIMIGTIKDYFPKTTIIWETSYWKGSVQTIKTYKDWSSLKYTIAKWFTWKTETWIDHIGIDPDIEMEDNSENSFVKNDKEIDELLEKAKSVK